jgi:hypothetical protein
MINKNITSLVNDLAEKYNAPSDRVLMEVIREEGKLHAERYSTNKGGVGLKDSYFYSAIGRVQERYKALDLFISFYAW